MYANAPLLIREHGRICVELFFDAIQPWPPLVRVLATELFARFVRSLLPIGSYAFWVTDEKVRNHISDVMLVQCSLVQVNRCAQM